jgi:hypothetical protein
MSEMPLGFCGLQGVIKGNPESTPNTFTQVYWGHVDRDATQTFFAFLYKSEWRVYGFYNSGSNRYMYLSGYLGAMVTNNIAQTITGLKTFTTLPESSVAPTNDNQLVNKAYVDGLFASISGGR